MNKKTQNTLLLGGAVAIGAFLIYRMKHKAGDAHVGWGGTPFPRNPFPFTPEFRGDAGLPYGASPSELAYNNPYYGSVAWDEGYEDEPPYVGAPPWSHGHYSGMPIGAAHGRNPALVRGARSSNW